MNKIIKYLRKYFWWRLSYKKKYLSGMEQYLGRCSFCDASPEKSELCCGCNNMCPCRFDQVLKKK